MAVAAKYFGSFNVTIGLDVAEPLITESVDGGTVKALLGQNFVAGWL